MYRIQPDDVEIHLNELPPQALQWDIASLDTEFFNQTLGQLHRPHGKFASLAVTLDGRNVYMITDEKLVAPFMAQLDEAMHVWHNSQYDLTQLAPYAEMKPRENIWDTFLMEKIKFSGYYSSFTLADLARRYCGIYLDKTERETFSANAENEPQTEMSDDQIFYAACDVVALWFVQKAQAEVVDEDDKYIWEEVERDFLYVLLSSGGIPFDAPKWQIRTESDTNEAARMMALLPFNPNSPKQVREYFLANFKIKMEATDEKTINALIGNPKYAVEKYGDAIELLKAILEIRGLRKAAGTYGMSWIEAMEDDGKLYPAYKQIGTETGRVSAAGAVGIQTMPHVPSYRECIIASPGHTLGIWDYSSQEPRILAYITGDKKLITMFAEGKDIYCSIGFEVFGEEFDKKDPRRQAMKSIILGVSYGMSKYGLAAKLGMSPEEAEDLLSIFFKKFPAVKRWVDECNEWKPYTTSILGRKFWGNPLSEGWSRNYQNMPCQASAADCTKIAAAAIVKRLGYCPLIIFMHDELVANIPNDRFDNDCEIIARTMSEVAEWQLENLIPCPVEQYTGPNWSSK